MMGNSQVKCWIVSDGIPGVENQCLGLATALGLTPVIKRVNMRWPWKQFAPVLRFAIKLAFSDTGDGMYPPWPDLLIASGRQSILSSLYVRKMSRLAGKRTFTVQIQNPRIDPAHFDLVVTPRHDRLHGANVISPLGSLHRVTPDLIATEAAKLAPRLKHLPPRRLAVLIGGSNAVYRLTPEVMSSIAAQLLALSKQGYGLMITTSRRTGDENLLILKEALRGTQSFLWDGQGDNPYFGMLGLAEAILVTGDSVNMISESCSTGKPVMVIPLAGAGSAKFRRFHQAFMEAGHTRLFHGTVEYWNHPPLDDVGMVAERVRNKMGFHDGKLSD